MEPEELLPYVMLLIITVAGVAITSLTVLGPNTVLSGTDDFIILQFANTVAHYGFGFAHLPPTTFTTAYLFEGVPAFFMDLFGSNIFTESSLGLITLIGAIITVFFIGKVQKDYQAGLIAALTFVLIPIVASEGATPGDNMPVAFITALSVLMLLLGVKQGKAGYHLLSGFLGLFGAIVGSAETLFVYVFLVPALLYLLLRERSRAQLINCAAFILGILIAAGAIALLSYALQSDPAAFFVHTFYHYPGSPQPQPGFVLSQVLPTNGAYLTDAANFSLFDYKSLIDTNDAFYLFSLFGYFALFGSIYLIAKRRGYALLPLAWLLLTVLYLMFGKSNPFYSEFLLIRPRFLAIVAPPMAVAVGLSASELLQSRLKNANARRPDMPRSMSYALLLFVVLAYAFASLTSIATMGLMHKTVLLNVYPWLQTAQMVSSFNRAFPVYVVSGLSASPGSASFSAPAAALEAYSANSLGDYLTSVNQVNWLGVEVYAGFKAPINYTTIFPNCSSLGSAYYISINIYPGIYPNTLPSCAGLTRIYAFNVSAISTELAQSIYTQRYGIWKNETIP